MSEHDAVIPATDISDEVRAIVNDEGHVIAPELSRRGSPTLVVNEDCEDADVPDARCVAPRLAQVRSDRWPRCWNQNATVVAGVACRAPSDGTPLPLCMEVAITQNAYLFECGGAFADDPHCGTFLEVHRPGHAAILAETRLKAQFTSGYVASIISLTYKQDAGRVLCTDPVTSGRYEVWWVLRTRYNFIVQRRSPFTVVAPTCDWDGDNNRYQPYATLGSTVDITDADYFAPQRLAFTRPRVEGMGCSACLNCW